MRDLMRNHTSIIAMRRTPGLCQYRAALPRRPSFRAGSAETCHDRRYTGESCSVEVRTMRRLFCFAPLLLLAAGAAHADKYSDAIASFKNAGDSAGFFQTCYGYAVFPTVGEAGFIVGGAHGKGRVYVQDKYVGDATMTQLSAGFQAGGKAYSQIIFFKDKRDLEENDLAVSFAARLKAGAQLRH